MRYYAREGRPMIRATLCMSPPRRRVKKDGLEMTLADLRRDAAIGQMRHGAVYEDSFCEPPPVQTN